MPEYRCKMLVTRVGFAIVEADTEAEAREMAEDFDIVSIEDGLGGETVDWELVGAPELVDPTAPRW